MKPLIIAHRGGALEAFENSPSAFRQALKIGADSIEVDLRATKDGKIVVMHDATLDRTASAQGKVRDFTLGQLKKIKLKNGELIPTLETLLKFAKNKINLHLEIKEAGFEAALVKILRKFKMSRSVYVISFYPKILSAIHEQDQKVNTGFLFAKAEDESACPEFCEIILPHERLINAKTAKRLNRMGKKIHAWVVNDAKRARRLVPLGIHGIITDCPASFTD